MQVLYGVELLAPHPPNCTATPYQLSATGYSIYSQISSIYRGRLLSPQPEDAPCRGERDSRNMNFTRITTKTKYHTLWFTSVTMKCITFFVLQLHFRLRKCKSKDNSKSCADFFKFEINNVCEKLTQKNQVWSGFLEKMHLNTKCPLQPVSNYTHPVTLACDVVSISRFI